jgi:hypothetical protein
MIFDILESVFLEAKDIHRKFPVISDPTKSISGFGKFICGFRKFIFGNDLIPI